MRFIEQPEVTVIAFTRVDDGAMAVAPDWEWERERLAPDLLTEFAGRVCYQSFRNPSGRSNAAYVANMLDQGHTSVLEHAAISFYLTGVSRSFSHELVRHRHHSFSQLSQRYVDSLDVNFVIPPEIRSETRLTQVFKAACGAAMGHHWELMSMLEAKLADVEDRVERTKRARQTARAVLPNATETRLVVTANLTAWRWFLLKRANSHADREMREVAVAIGKCLVEYAPGVFQDFHLVQEKDGFWSFTGEHAK